jgi:FixJ family two-component response regulator
MRKCLADNIRGYRCCQVPNSGPIVAIVDDDEAVRNAIVVLMRSMGLVAQAFSSGEEFLRSPELSRTGCLVVDFNMPKMSGLDLHNNLSRLGKEIPTVLITAYPSDDIRARAIQAGIICYLPKPFDESDLLNCIQAALDRAKGNRGAP